MSIIQLIWLSMEIYQMNFQCVPFNLKVSAFGGRTHEHDIQPNFNFIFCNLFLLLGSLKNAILQWKILKVV